MVCANNEIYRDVPYWRWDGRPIVEHIAASRVLPDGAKLAELRNKLQYLEGGWVTVYNDLATRWLNEIYAEREEESFDEGDVIEDATSDQLRFAETFLSQLRQLLYCPPPENTDVATHGNAVAAGDENPPVLEIPADGLIAKNENVTASDDLNNVE
ncbi:MAG: hypothetical protein LBD36_03020 [Holosporales bacterium]|nr:hypothetical protein [Holosporales bacterium]